MNESAVADTGPFLHLVGIDHESHFCIFRKVYISEQIKSELENYNVFDKMTKILGNSIVIERVYRQEINEQKRILSGFKIHQSDLSVAVLARKLLPEIVLTDDLELRKGLETQGHMVVGSIGILIRAFKQGRLTKSELSICFDKLFNDESIYLSKGLRNYVYKLLDNL
jgi:predicted nucleic acid-binding protein